MIKTILSLVVLACSLILQPAHAALSPVSLAIVPPVQFPPADFSVTGARLSVLYGHHRDLYGLDLGVLGNITDQDFVGLALAGGFNATHGLTTIIGLQAAGIANYNTNKVDVFGLQIAAIANTNIGESSVTGLQVAMANLSHHTTVYGAQLGIYNSAREVYGFQIGVVNVTENLHGLQIGLANFHTKGLFVVSPIINVGF